MLRMMDASRSSVWSNVQLSRDAFCCISNAEVATPPALAALPGAKSTPASWKMRTASGVDGMFAPSPTAITPFFTSMLASLPVSSFCVADGMAMSQGTSQTEPSSMKRSEEHTSELQSLMRISYAVFCLKKNKSTNIQIQHKHNHHNMI